MARIIDFIAEESVPDFFKKERQKITLYLIKHYGVSMVQAEEAFQNGSLAMFDNMAAGKLTKENLQYSLSSYLTACCIRQLHKEMDRREEKLREEMNEMLLDKKEAAEYDEQREGDKQLMESIVRQMPSPCNELIFGRYYNKETMEEMAAMYGLKNANVAKVKLHRCLKKLKTRFFELREN